MNRIISEKLRIDLFRKIEIYVQIVIYTLNIIKIIDLNIIDKDIVNTVGERIFTKFPITRRIL